MIYDRAVYCYLQLEAAHKRTEVMYTNDVNDDNNKNLSATKSRENLCHGAAYVLVSHVVILGYKRKTPPSSKENK